MWTSPLYFAANGGFYGYLDGVGNDGYFWAPVPDGSDDAKYAYFGVNGGVNPSDYDGRSYGSSVRCVLRPVVNSVFGGGGWIPVN